MCIDSIWFGDIKIFWYTKLCMKTRKFCKFFLYDFLNPKCFNTSWPKCFDTSRSKCVDSSCKQYIYNRNIIIFCHTKLCIKTWYSSNSFWILSIFLVWFYGPKMFWDPTLYTTANIKSMEDEVLAVGEWIFLFVLFNWDSLHVRLNSHYEAWSYKKRSTKKITGYRKSV